MSETNKDTKETNPITVEKGEQKPGALVFKSIYGNGTGF